MNYKLLILDADGNQIHNSVWPDEESAFVFVLKNLDLTLGQKYSIELDVPTKPMEIPKERLEAMQALSYLRETDWYVTRKAETGKDIPSDVLDKRADARLKIN